MSKWTPERIKKFRETLGLYQRELAKILGVTEIYVNYLENGKRKPSKTLEMLLDCIEREHKSSKDVKKDITKEQTNKRKGVSKNEPHNQKKTKNGN